jgi:hypothetical protein
MEPMCELCDFDRYSNKLFMKNKFWNFAESTPETAQIAHHLIPLVSEHWGRARGAAHGRRK